MAQYNSGIAAPVILGANTAQQYWLQENNANKQRMEQQRVLKERDLRKTNSKFAEDLNGLAEISTTDAYTKELGDIVNGMMTEGAKFLAEGIDPYRSQSDLSPKNRESVSAFQKDVAEVKRIKSVIDKFSAKKSDMDKRIENDPTSYDIDEYKDAVSFENKYTLEDLASGNFTMPTLSKKYDIDAEDDKIKDMSITEKGYRKDTNGNDVAFEEKRADIGRISQTVDSLYAEGSDRYNKVEKILKKAGFKEGQKGILGTTDKAKIRETLDAQFKSATDGNPIIPVMAKGKIPSFDSPEYESFLDDASSEQLRAEKIVADRKAKTGQTIANKTNPLSSEKLDFTRANQAIKRSANLRSIAKDNLSMKIGRARLTKLENGDDDDNSLLSQTVDVNYDVEGVDQPFVLANAYSFKSSAVDLNPAPVTNMKTGKQEKAKEVRGSVSGVGAQAYDKQGNPVSGNPSELAKNLNITFKPRVMIQYGKTGREKTSLYESSYVPTNGMPKSDAAEYQKALKLAQKTSDEFNSRPKRNAKDFEKKKSDNSFFEQTTNPQYNTPAIKLKKLEY